jgi:hypothetical protein
LFDGKCKGASTIGERKVSEREEKKGSGREGGMREGERRWAENGAMNYGDVFEQSRIRASGFPLSVFLFPLYV